MDIFPKMLGEAEFRNFNDKDYEALLHVLDDVTARYLIQYCNNSNADQSIVNAIESHLGTTMKALTFHLELKDSGILELVRSLSPESLPVADVDLDMLIEKLSFLEEHEADIKSAVPKRSKDAFDNFYAAMHSLISRMLLSGQQPTYIDAAERIKANSFIFYQSREKDHATGVGILNSRKRQWTLVLNGARWLKYCNEKKLPYATRSAF